MSDPTYKTETIEDEWLDEEGELLDFDDLDDFIEAQDYDDFDEGEPDSFGLDSLLGDAGWDAE